MESIPTITMPVGMARRKLAEYRKSLRHRADREYIEVAEAYEQLAKGTPIVSLEEAFASLTPSIDHFDKQWRPLLAIARADRKQVHLTDDWNDGSAYRFDTHKSRGPFSQGLQVSVQRSTDFESVRRGGYSLVPMIPADVRNRMRERRNGGANRHYILWEVERWADRPIQSTPDRDPWLLLPIGEPGVTDLYAVVDSWDLTDMEMYVMRGRRHEN